MFNISIFVIFRFLLGEADSKSKSNFCNIGIDSTNITDWIYLIQLIQKMPFLEAELVGGCLKNIVYHLQHRFGIAVQNIVHWVQYKLSF